MVGLEDFPFLEIQEPLCNEGFLEFEEGRTVPRKAVLTDPNGNTGLAEIGNPQSNGELIRYSYRVI